MAAQVVGSEQGLGCVFQTNCMHSDNLPQEIYRDSHAKDGAQWTSST